LVLGLVVWIIGRAAGFSAASFAHVLRNFPQFWLPTLVVLGLAVVLLWPRASGRRRRPDVIGISSTTVYLDIAGRFRHVQVEVPRHELHGIELVFPQRSLSTRPKGLRIHLAGQQPAEIGDDCSSAQLLAVFAELKAAVLRTSKGNP
jgi:hypothetical protein